MLYMSKVQNTIMPTLTTSTNIEYHPYSLIIIIIIIIIIRHFVRHRNMSKYTTMAPTA